MTSGERSQWVFFHCFVRAACSRWSTDIREEGGDCKDKNFGHTLDTSNFGIYVGLISLKMSQMNSPMATGTAGILVED